MGNAPQPSSLGPLLKIRIGNIYIFMQYKNGITLTLCYLNNIFDDMYSLTSRASLKMVKFSTVSFRNSSSVGPSLNIRIGNFYIFRSTILFLTLCYLNNIIFDDTACRLET